MLPSYDRQRLKEVFAGARALPAEQRRAYVADACGGNDALRQEVESLLASNDRAKSFLEAPAAVQGQDTVLAKSLEGQRIGSYQIEGWIGAGGMGEVYRALDTKLNRLVAIKVLLPAVADDPDRLARFSREAQLLASLNHPHIAHIYGVEDAGGLRALVMELVEGPTLADRIAQGAVPVHEALAIAKQIAEALEAAHGQGIIHRDLKPANIKVREDGRVKVLDFGVAKAIDPRSGAGLGAMSSPAPGVVATEPGVIIGTAAYISPEQARGRPVDRRADLWAFGAVLYEMLTGRRAFPGETVSDTIVAILEREPDWNALSADVPLPVRTLIRRSLAKDQRQRIADISVAQFVLEDPSSAPPMTATIAERPSLWRRIAIPSSMWLIGVAMSGAAFWLAPRPREPVPPRVSRLRLAPSGTAALTIIGADRDLAIAPDGSRLVYVGNRGTQLFVRALDALEPVAVFTGAPRGPFVSPDGQWIGFTDGGNVLKKVAMTGGPAVTLATLDANTRGATWGPDDTIIVATQSVTTGLQRVSAAGGPTTVLTRPDRAQSEADHFWPELLPGGRAVLFTITAVTGGLDAAQVAVLDLQTGARTVLVRGGSHAHYVPGGLGSPERDDREGGHLVYAAAGALRAVTFGLARLETRGTPVPVVPDVMTTPQGGMEAVVAGDGTLAYVPGGVAGTSRTFVWVDRQGRETPIPAPPRAYAYPRLSPAGTRIAVFAFDQEIDIWIWDLGRTTLTRATFDPGLDVAPAWTHDGRRVIFSSERAGTRNLFWQAVDGTGAVGAVERLTESPNMQHASAVSPDGRFVIFTETAPTTANDVMQMTLDGTRRVTPLVQTPFVEQDGIVSPDGRWLAYEANDSGRIEISVRPFPEVNGGRWQVSTAGGTRPLWAPSGQELFYISPTGALMRVGVQRGPSWAATTPTQLVKEGYATLAGGNFGRTYDIAPDGQRFLMIKDAGTDQTAAPPSLIVVQHWDQELKRLVPTH